MDDNTVRQWDAETGQPIGASLMGHTGTVRSVAYRSDGRYLVSGSSDATLRQWDAETGEQIGAPLTGHTGIIWSVVYRPDGCCIVSGSHDETIRLWNAESHCCLAVLRWHQSVTSVAFCAEPVLTSALADSKAVISRSTVAAPTAEYRLAIGDAAGTISFWAISVKHPEAGFRLVNMPKHASMPLMVNTAILKDGQMSAMSKRLLEQHGGDVSQVNVVPDEVEPTKPESKTSPTGTSSNTGMFSNSTTTSAPISRPSVSTSQTRSAGPSSLQSSADAKAGSPNRNNQKVA
jgi:WD40 repeat protein